MTEYTPELGQAAFGQPWQPYQCPEWLEDILWDISEALEETGKFRDGTPFGRAGGFFENKVFQVHAYDWSDREQQWNFRYGDFVVSWYKYLGRGTTINKEITLIEANQMKEACIQSLRRKR